MSYRNQSPQLGGEPFCKIEGAMPVEQLAPLQVTLCPLELEAIRQTGTIIFRFYREVATELSARRSLSIQSSWKG